MPLQVDQWVCFLMSFADQAPYRVHFFHQFTEYFAASDSDNFNHEAKFAFDSVDSGDILPIVENINMKKATGPDKFLHKQSRKTNVFQFQF